MDWEAEFSVFAYDPMDGLEGFFCGGDCKASLPLIDHGSFPNIFQVLKVKNKLVLHIIANESVTTVQN